MKLCGELGHEKKDGQPCSKPQGWGVEGTDEGPCRYHDGRDQRTRDATKKAVLKYLARPELTLREVARKVGRAPNTIWGWRQRDKEFDRRCAAAMARANDIRVQLVEDSLFRRIITDRVNPAETIFFLKNHAPDRWKDKPVSAPTSKGGESLIPAEALRSLFDDDD